MTARTAHCSIPGCLSTATVPDGMSLQNWAALAGWVVLPDYQVLCRSHRPRTVEGTSQPAR